MVVPDDLRHGLTHLNVQMFLRLSIFTFQIPSFRFLLVRRGSSAASPFLLFVFSTPCTVLALAPCSAPEKMSKDACFFLPDVSATCLLIFGRCVGNMPQDLCPPTLAGTSPIVLSFAHCPVSFFLALPVRIDSIDKHSLGGPADGASSHLISSHLLVLSSKHLDTLLSSSRLF